MVHRLRNSDAATDASRPDARMADFVVQGYVEQLVATIRRLTERSSAPPAGELGSRHQAEVVGTIFDTLCRREFCYLSKARAVVYRRDIDEKLTRRVLAGEALRFYYDIGGGYHASLDPSRDALRFDVGFAELCVLRQIASFIWEIRAAYQPGAHFSLVVDNLCACLVNDIPTSRTSEYCAQLRALIVRLGLEQHVDVLVESERFDLDQYKNRDVESIVVGDPRPTPREIENASRFVGRECGPHEAAQRIELYRLISQESERLIDSVIDGVHMTQRATEKTFGFRSFPGGAARIQTGLLGVMFQGAETLRPVLITSRTRGDYAHFRTVLLEHSLCCYVPSVTLAIRNSHES